MRGEKSQKRTGETDPPDGMGIPPRSGGGALPKSDLRKTRRNLDGIWERRVGGQQARGHDADARTPKASKPPMS